MTSDIFFEYFANTYIPELAAIRRQERGLGPDDELILTHSDWVVFWIDGYSSHLTYHTSKLCELNHIVLYCFKAYSSHICQPNDVGPFQPLKSKWRKAVAEWRVRHPYTLLSQVNFAQVLSAALQKLDQESIISGHRSTGLCPFDENAVHYERLTATNRRKYDDRAFGIKDDDGATNLGGTDVALRSVESLLGGDLISQHKQVQDLAVVELSSLPSVHSYIIWHHLLSVANGDATDQRLPVMSLAVETDCTASGLELQLVPDGHLLLSEPPAAADNASVAVSSDMAGLTVRLQSTSSPSKFKRGIPQRFAGKVSPAFDKHIFGPVRLKRRKTAKLSYFQHVRHRTSGAAFTKRRRLPKKRLKHARGVIKNRSLNKETNTKRRDARKLPARHHR